MLKVFKVGNSQTILSVPLMAFAMLSACVPNDAAAPIDETPVENSDLIPRTSLAQKEVSRLEPFFPFGISKTCGNEYPRLKLASLQYGYVQQGNISLWETIATRAVYERYVIWNEVSQCGFTFETPPSNGAGPFRNGRTFVILSKYGEITSPVAPMIIDGHRFEGFYYNDISSKDRTKMESLYRDRFRACLNSAGNSDLECVKETQDWVDNNSATLSLALITPRDGAPSLFMIEDRLWWAGREIE